MSGYVSTSAAVERTGLTYRQLDWFVRRRFVAPRLLASTGEQVRKAKPDARRWSPADIATARVVGDIVTAGESPRTDALARLAAEGVALWHGRAPWIVVALEGDTIKPAWSTEEAVATAADHTVATLIALDPV